MRKTCCNVSTCPSLGSAVGLLKSYGNRKCEPLNCVRAQTRRECFQFEPRLRTSDPFFPRCFVYRLIRERGSMTSRDSTGTRGFTTQFLRERTVEFEDEKSGRTREILSPGTVEILHREKIRDTSPDFLSLNCHRNRGWHRFEEMKEKVKEISGNCVRRIPNTDKTKHWRKLSEQRTGHCQESKYFSPGPQRRSRGYSLDDREEKDRRKKEKRKDRGKEKERVS